VLKNDLLLRTARGEKVERTPVWVMRQAGRILPEYRAVRASVNGFKELVKNPELIAEVTIQPVDILGVDAAIIFSDILVIPEAMGLDYEMVEKSGPFFSKTIHSKADIDKLYTGDITERLDYVVQGIKFTKQELANRVPLIGFAGAPFTIFCYMIEGKGSKTFSKAKAFLYQQPEAAHLLLEKITQVTIQYLQLQIQSGADIIQIFDSWASILSPRDFNTFSLPYIEKIAQAITLVPVIGFAKGANAALPEFNKGFCDIIGLDWTITPEEARMLVPNKVLQGNLDPCVLYADKATIKREVESCLQSFGSPNHIFNLGHGVYPDIEWEKVKFMIETVQSFEHTS
jgi:uroporphyrinogen decarboxylase